MKKEFCQYDLMLIIIPGSNEEEKEKLINEIKEFTLDKVIKIDEENSKKNAKLAYKIKGIEKADYLNFNFIASKKEVINIKILLKKKNFILRDLLVNLTNEKYVKNRKTKTKPQEQNQESNFEEEIKI